MRDGHATAGESRRRVLLVTQDLYLFGAQRQLVELALGLDHRRYDVRVAMLDREGPLMEPIRAAGLAIESFPRRWRWDLGVVPRLARYLRRERIDVVHSFLFLPNFYSRLAGRLAGTPAIVSSLRSTGIEGAHRYLLDILTCPLCHVLVANSEAGRRHYVRRGGLSSRVIVIKNGIDLARFGENRLPQELLDSWRLDRFNTLLGMVAAMEQRKDHPLLLRAMARIVKEQPSCGLLLAGEGSRRADLERLTRQLELEPKVVFAGSVRQAEALYPHFAIYVQASRSEEGVSNSILEAMVSGLPVVATDIGGNREVVVDGETGYVVPGGDEQALTEALLRLLCSSELRRKLGAAGRARVESTFALSTMVDRTASLYESLLESRPRHRS